MSSRAFTASTIEQAALGWLARIGWHFSCAQAITPLAGHQVGTKLALSEHHVQILALAEVPRSLLELMAPSGRTDRTKFRHQVLDPLVEAGPLEPTVPDKPRSSKQRYRLTAGGRRALDSLSSAGGREGSR